MLIKDIPNIIDKLQKALGKINSNAVNDKTITNSIENKDVGQENWKNIEINVEGLCIKLNYSDKGIYFIDIFYNDEYVNHITENKEINDLLSKIEETFKTV